MNHWYLGSAFYDVQSSLLVSGTCGSLQGPGRSHSDTDWYLPSDKGKNDNPHRKPDQSIQEGKEKKKNMLYSEGWCLNPIHKHTHTLENV